MSATPRLRGLILTTVAVVVVAACGSPDEPEPEAVAPAPSVTSLTPTTPPPTTSAPSPTSAAPSPSDTERDEPEPEPEEEPQDEELDGTWEGTVTISVDYFAPCSASFDWIEVGSQSYRQPAQVAVNAPQQDDGNNFQLSISTSRQTTEAGFTMVSSGRFNTSSGPLTLTYWDLTENDGRISGRLVDTHSAEGVAQNLFYTNKRLDPCSDRLGSVLVPLLMDVGTTISGRLGDRDGSLRVEGRTTDWLRGYRLDFDLDRVD
ncbi:hypothetical protein ACI2K4_06710 [Micromonospora sp. NPDC050397]|uniref:hypothetical protein n=1 Tax=Micromonospora sp. NPDC050397 TaxID=3364279 RepID=UPI00384CA40E